MKGRLGSPLAILEAMEAGGWKAADESGEDFEAPPVTQQDDGEEFV